MKVRFAILFALHLGLPCYIASAAPGDPDVTFGNLGVVSGGLSAVTVHSNGKIIAAGGAAVTRLNTNGSPDTSFGANGSVTVPFAISGYDRAVAVQSDGKVVVVGTDRGDFAIVRLNTDGTLDTSFGGTGTVKTNVGFGSRRGPGPNPVTEPIPTDDSASGLVIQSDGKIVVAGTSVQNIQASITNVYSTSMAVIRYNIDGTTDASYGSFEKYLLGQMNGAPPAAAATSIALRPDQTVAATGWSASLPFNKTPGYGFYFVSLNSGGTPTTLGSKLRPYYGNFSDHDEWLSIAVSANETVYVAGTALILNLPQESGAREFAMLGYGTGGFVVTGPQGRSARSIAVQQDGKLVVAGTSLNRFNSDGSADTDFSPGRGGNSVALQSDARILVAGGGGLSRYESALQFPEINIEQPPGANLTDGSSTVSFGGALIGNVASRTFTVRNTAVSNLLILGISIDGTHAAEFKINTPPPVYLAGGSSETFTLSCTPAAYGARTAVLHIISRDLDEGSFDIDLIATGIGPEITVEQPLGTELVAGAAVIEFRSVSPEKMFTIRNAGTGVLSDLALTELGSHTGDFIVGSLAANYLAAGAEMQFAVTFTPTAAGDRTAVLRIASDDPEENPFEINLTGRQSTPTELWRHNYFASTDNAGDGADLSDPDGDGIVNLMEFATGSDPKSLTLAIGQLVKNGGTLEFTYTRPKAALEELRYDLEASTTTVTWGRTGQAETILSDDGITQQVKATYPAGITGKRFVRLRVTRL